MRARKLGTMVLIAVCAAGGLWLFAAVLFPLLLPLFIGLAVAAMARKPVSMLERQTKLPRGLAAFLCVLGIYALAGTGLFLLCRLLCREVGGFLHQLPELAGRLEGPAKALQDRLYAIADKFPEWAPAFARDLRAFLKAAQDLARSSMNGFLRSRPAFWESFRIWCSAR